MLLEASPLLSRQPVREVFVNLAKEGLVEVRPQRGTTLRKYSIVDAIEQEKPAEGKRAARRHLRETLATLPGIAEAQSRILETED